MLGIAGPRHSQPDLRGWLLGVRDSHSVVPRKGACFHNGMVGTRPGTNNAPHVVVGHGPLRARRHTDMTTRSVFGRRSPAVLCRGSSTRPANADDRQREWCRGAAAGTAPIQTAPCPSGGTIRWAPPVKQATGRGGRLH